MTKPKVLLVDNSPLVTRIVRDILERLQCQVQTAADGLEAFDLLPLYQPDIIFTDLVMPKIDGAKLCFLVRNTAAFKNTFLVVLSGIAVEDDENLLHLGADMCIAKGPPTAMEENIRIALQRYNDGKRGDMRLYGMKGLCAREVTSELLSSKYHNEIVLEKMSEGVVELDRQGRIVRANRAALGIFQLPEERLLTTFFPIHLAPGEASVVREWIDRLDAQPLRALEYDYDHPLTIGGRLITLYLAPIREDSNLFLTGLLSDISLRKEAEARERELERELERMKRLEAMSRMASGLSHDFNNLLTIINGNLELIRLRDGQDGQLRSLLDETDKAMTHAMHLIRQFTSFSDNCLPRRAEVQIGSLVRELVSHFFRDSSINVDFQCQPGLWPVNVDTSQIIQVLTNVLQNSLEAVSDRHGAISIHLDTVSGGPETYRPGEDSPMQPGGHVRIVVADNGPGLDSEVLEHAFEPYFSTKQKGVQKGMGLGLTIVHAIVKKHGGQVSLRNSPDGGAVLTILLPAVSPDPDAPGEKKRVLIMDDDAMIRTVGAKMLEHLGCRAETAENGEQVLELVAKATADDDSFSLIILDQQVDCGMDGGETARQLQKRDGHPPLVITSGAANSEMLRNPLQYGFVASLVKPFSMENLEELLPLTCATKG